MHNWVHWCPFGGWVKQLRDISLKENRVAFLLTNCFCSHMESVIFVCIIQMAWQRGQVPSRTLKHLSVRTTGSWRLESLNAAELNPPGHVSFRRLGDIRMCVHAQSCPTLHDPMDRSLPGFSVHRILQVRILEWVATSFSRGSSQPRNQTRVSCICLLHWRADSLLLAPPGKPHMCAHIK